MNIDRPLFNFMTHRRRILPPYLIIAALLLLAFFSRQFYLIYRNVFASTPTLIQSKDIYSASQVVSQSLIFDNPVKNGSLIVVAVTAYSANTPNVTSVADNKGNIYVRAAVNPTAPTGKHQLSVWYAANVVGGSNFMVNIKPDNANSYVTAAGHEYTDVVEMNPLDQVQISNGSSMIADSGATLPIAQAEELVFAAFLHEDVGDIPTNAGNGYTMRENQIDGSYEPLVTEDRTVSSVGSYNASVEWGQKVAWKSAIVTFRLIGTGNLSQSGVIIPTSTPSPTIALGKTLTKQIGSSSDDVNQDGTVMTIDSSQIWLGTSASTASYTGLRYTNLLIPRSAVITSAHLEVYSTTGQESAEDLIISAQAIGNSQTFSQSNNPALGPFTKNAVEQRAQGEWAANNWYSLNDIKGVLQEIINRSDWQPGNSISLILKGTSSPYSRKYVQSWNGSAIYAPKLVITYQ